MKIGIDMRCFARGKTTGVEGYAKNFLTAVFTYDKVNEYHLFFNAWKGQEIDLSWLENFEHVHVHHYRIPNKLLNATLWFFQWPKLDTLCGGVDLFFMPNANFFALSRHVPLLLTVHDLSHEHYPKSFSIRMRVWHFFVNARLMIKRSAHIIAVSEATKSDIMQTYGTDHAKISVAHNGRTMMSGKIDRNSIAIISVKEKYSLPYQFILFFGTIEPRKNILSVVCAYETLRRYDPSLNIKLVIAGSCGWRMEHIHESIKRSSYSRDIIVIMDIPEADKEPLIVLASVLVYPSFFEGFGFPPLEALMCNIPVIVSHTSSLPEVVGRYAIMVDPHRSEEIVIALAEILCDRRLRSHFIDDRHDLHVRRFTWIRAAEIFLASVKKIVDQRG